MSFITITSLPNIPEDEMTAWVVRDLIGLRVGLCLPQQIFCIGFSKKFGSVNDITDVTSNSFAVSPERLIYALKVDGKKKTAKWFENKFKFRNSDLNPNDKIILINSFYCEYSP